MVSCVYVECTGSCCSGLLICWHVGWGGFQSIRVAIVGMLSLCVLCGSFGVSVIAKLLKASNNL